MSTSHQAGKSRPEVTVVIPTRNRYSLLTRHALASAFRQEDVTLEVIVVDDGSTDETSARLAELDEPRLAVLRTVAAQGVSHARNRGIEAASGGWIAFLDDDDIWSPRKLRVQLDAAAAAGASFAYSSAVVIDTACTPVDVVRAPDAGEVARALLTRNVVPGGGSGAIARTDLVGRVGGFDEALRVLEEWDLWIRLAAAGSSAACPEILVGYLIHEQNLTVTAQADLFVQELDYLAVKHGARMRSEEIALDRVALLQWLAWEHRRVGRNREAAHLAFRAAVVGKSPTMALRNAAAIVLRVLAPSGRATHAVRASPDTLSTDELAWLAGYRDVAGEEPPGQRTFPRTPPR